MRRAISEPAPGSNATTKDTEPQVVAAISSAEGTSELSPTSGSGGLASAFARPLLLLTAGAMLGYGAGRWLRPWR